MVDEPLLHVDALSVSYGGLRAVDDFGMHVDRGAIVGLIGPNGAGKTTFIDALTGFTPSTGSVVFNGHSLTGMPPHQRARHGLSRTFQSLELFEDLTVRENLQTAAARHRWWSVVTDLVLPHRAVDDNNLAWVLSLLGLDDVADNLPGELSHGKRKLVSVARALVTRPKLLLLDEPAAGLSSSESLEFGNELTKLRDADTTIFLVDHDMGLVLSTCDHIYVLEFGKLIAEGNPAEIRRDPRVISAYLGAHADEQVSEVETARPGEQSSSTAGAKP